MRTIDRALAHIRMIFRQLSLFQETTTHAYKIHSQVWWLAIILDSFLWELSLALSVLSHQLHTPYTHMATCEIKQKLMAQKSQIYRSNESVYKKLPLIEIMYIHINSGE